MKPKLLRWVGLSGLLLGLWHGGATADPSEALQRLPEADTGQRRGEAQWFAHQAVAAAHPLAAEAGAQMLRQGGNALDAAIAVQAMLSLVEPQSSGIGGGAFLLWWNGQTVQAWDGRETAPAAAGPTLFIGPDGQPLAFADAVASGLSVGVPGVLRMLEQAHRAAGQLPWAQLFAPAIAQAEQGFAIGPRLHSLLQGARSLQADAAARAFYYLPGEPLRPWPVGHVLRNPALAEVLHRVAREGADAFYRGPVAQAIARKVAQAQPRPGLLSAEDLTAYRAVQREPLCTAWRERYRVCGFPPPSSGHITLMQLLGMVPPPAADAPAPGTLPRIDWLYHYSEAARLAYADRALYLADPAFVAAPAGQWASLLAPDYLRQRARLIGPRSLGQASAGQPGPQRSSWAPQPEQAEYGTSHLSVVDRAGRAVAMTSSIEAGFGSGLLVDGGTGLAGGFLLNNQLTDFSFTPTDAQGRLVANRVEPGKRPRSSMAPTLVFDAHSGQLLLNLGSPGGPAIIHFVAKSLLATLDWGWPPGAALALANFGSFNGPTWLETGQFPDNYSTALRQRGQAVITLDLPSGVQLIQRQGEGWAAAADPRREGAVRGQ